MTSQLSESHYKQRIFAVDIGTRSVIGLVGYVENEKLVVEYGDVQYHKNRVMIDGQIQEIDGVAESIKVIKENLEQACGLKFTEVAIAAAGRSLITGRAKLEQEIDDLMPIKKNVIDSLETTCLQNIYSNMIEDSHEMKDYFCIGHSVVSYYLNGKSMLSLLGHKGSRIGVDLVATFLPRTVVDSLYIAVSQIGLDVSYLTLEPIAAIEVAVPSNIRLLNIALVDIGAGTSDIAITKDGTVVAYAMTSTAGDEITEALAKTYMLDFDSAELLKCKLSEQSTQKFIDIFGIEHEVSSEEILEKLADVIDLIAKNIVDNVIEKNGKSPSAVFLTGGGSKIPGLNGVIANYFDLPKERVSTRDVTNIPNLIVSNFNLTGPEVITPIGILAKAISHFGRDFIEVFVNEASVKLFNTKTLMVLDALMLTGFNPQNLIAKAGKVFIVDVNGQKKKFYGTVGEHGAIYANGDQVNISTLIKAQDKIVIVPAKHGEDPSLKLREVIPANVKFKLNESFKNTISKVRVNGKAAKGNIQINDQDSISFDQIITVGDLLKRFKIQSNLIVLVNGVKIDNRYVILDQDHIEIKELSGENNDFIELIFDDESTINQQIGNIQEEVQSIEQFSLFDETTGTSSLASHEVNQVIEENEILITMNSLSEFSHEIIDPIGNKEFQAKEDSLFKNEDQSSTITITYNGSNLSLPGEKPLMFVNLFDYIDFDRTRPQGNLHMTHNGGSASYFDPITNGDIIEIKWIENVE